MRRLPTALCALAAIPTFGAPAFAHHSVAMFDASKEILIEGKVARFDWVNPHAHAPEKNYAGHAPRHTGPYLAHAAKVA